MEILEQELNQIKKIIKESLSGSIADVLLKDFLYSDSKFIRSKLALLYLFSNGCNVDKNIYKILAAGEIIHNASLLHDDVLDDAKMRRGRPTLGAQISSKVAILTGDYLLSLAIENILEVDSKDILLLFKNCVKKMTESELRQFYLRGKLPEKQDYIEICKGKTAELFASILAAIATLANIDVMMAKTFGELYGLCFQVKNDLDVSSARIDRANGIYTANEVLGIEKTSVLLDNCREEMLFITKDFQESIYKENLEDLVKSL